MGAGACGQAAPFRPQGPLYERLHQKPCGAAGRRVRAGAGQTVATPAALRGDDAGSRRRVSNQWADPPDPAAALTVSLSLATNGGNNTNREGLPACRRCLKSVTCTPSSAPAPGWCALSTAFPTPS